MRFEYLSGNASKTLHTTTERTMTIERKPVWNAGASEGRRKKSKLGQGAMRREVLGNQGSCPTIPKHKLRRQERARYPGSIIFSVIASVQAASVSEPRRVLPAQLFQEIQVNSGQWRRRFSLGSSRCEFHESLPGSLPYQRGSAAPFHLNRARPLPIRGSLGRGDPEGCHRW